MQKVMSINRVEYTIIKLLGHGKGGYSYLVEKDGKLNSCGLWADQALGYAMGPLLGMAAASLIPEKDQEK